jgi:hypothetical protein
VLLFPPVFSIMAVIWPDALLAGSLLAATGAGLQESRRWKVAAAILFMIACSCRPEAALAIVPLVLLGGPGARRWRRAGLALALAIGIAGTARLANSLLTVTDTYSWEQELQMMDTVGTLRRAKVKDEAALRKALEGLPLADPATMRERMISGADAVSYRQLVFGDKNIFDPDPTTRPMRCPGAARSAPPRRLPPPSLDDDAQAAASRHVEAGLRRYGSPICSRRFHRATSSDWRLRHSTSRAGEHAAVPAVALHAPRNRGFVRCADRPYRNLASAASSD